MGGKALKNTFTERKNTNDFLKIFSEISNILTVLLGEVTLTKYYHNKESHGDMDILLKITPKNKNINIKETIREKFQPNEIVNNGGIISFDYKKLQIDIIPIKDYNWDSARFWYSYDPIPNLVGKTAHKFGLKFGQSGLIFPVRLFSGRIVKNIIISKNNRNIFEFLGYDYNRYLKGFDTKQEIFDWVVNSKYFDSDMFKMQNLNQKDRKRNNKRKTYQEFISYLKNNNIKKTYKFKDKEEYIDEISEFFPNSRIKNKIDKLKEEDNKEKEIASKFNGKMVMNKYKWLKGKKLGFTIKKFKHSFKDFEKYILDNDSENIMDEFDKFLSR